MEQNLKDKMDLPIRPFLLNLLEHMCENGLPPCPNADFNREFYMSLGLPIPIPNHIRKARSQFMDRIVKNNPPKYITSDPLRNRQWKTVYELFLQRYAFQLKRKNSYAYLSIPDSKRFMTLQVDNSVGVQVEDKTMAGYTLAASRRVSGSHSEGDSSRNRQAIWRPAPARSFSFTQRQRNGLMTSENATSGDASDLKIKQKMWIERCQKEGILKKEVLSPMDPKTPSVNPTQDLSAMAPSSAPGLSSLNASFHPPHQSAASPEKVFGPMTKQMWIENYNKERNLTWSTSPSRKCFSPMTVPKNPSPRTNDETVKNDKPLEEKKEN